MVDAKEIKSLDRAAKAYLRTLLKCGDALWRKGESDSTNPKKDFSLKQTGFKGTHLHRVLVVSFETEVGTDLYATDGHLAVGPVPISEEVQKSLADCGKLPSGNKPESLSAVCPELMRARCADLVLLSELNFIEYVLNDKWVAKRRDIGKVAHALFGGQEKGVGVNPVYLLAALQHILGESCCAEDVKDRPGISIYQKEGESIGPVLLVGEGKCAVLMPVRLD